MTGVHKNVRKLFVEIHIFIDKYPIKIIYFI